MYIQGIKNANLVNIYTQVHFPANINMHTKEGYPLLHTEASKRSLTAELVH